MPTGNEVTDIGLDPESLRARSTLSLVLELDRLNMPESRPFKLLLLDLKSLEMLTSESDPCIYNNISHYDLKKKVLLMRLTDPSLSPPLPLVKLRNLPISPRFFLRGPRGISL